MEIITEPFHQKFLKSIKQAKDSLTLISPYITIAAANLVIECIHNCNLSRCRLVTLPPGKEYVDGATEVEALLLLKNAGFEIRMLERLHAKIYCIDDYMLYIGSANLTSKGLGLIPAGNREIMLKSIATTEQLKQIEEEYWDEASKTHITEAWLERIKEYIGDLKIKFNTELSRINEEMKIEFPYHSPYEELLLHLKQKGIIKTYEHKSKGYLKHVYSLNKKYHVKVLRSKQGTLTDKGFEQVFNYQVQEKTAQFIKMGKIEAILLILEEPDTFVCLPAKVLDNKVLLKTYMKSNNDWQFKIKRMGQQLFLTAKGKRSVQQHDITEFEGKLRFSLSGKHL